MNATSAPGWRHDLLLLSIVIGAFFCLGLGARPYLTPSEARYIELPRQMLTTGDWLTPHIDGVPYFEKPPLFYWMQAAVMGVLGTGEFAGRIVTALLDTGLCLITYALGRLLYSRLTGLFAAAVVASCVMGYALSRAAMLDMPVSLFLTAVFACFLAAQYRVTFAQRRWLYWLMYVAAAAAMMTKGLIGVVIPGLVIGTWIVATRRWYILKEAQLLPGLAIFLVLTVPWHWLMAREHPHFLNFYFINEHFTRYLTDSHKRVEPWWFFIAITLAGLLPWTGLLPAAIAAFPRVHSGLRLMVHEQSDGERTELDLKLDVNNNMSLFILLWVLLPLVFFSTSHSKLAPYILPIFPPLAIVLGRYLAECWTNQAATRALRWNHLFVAALFAAALAVYFALPRDSDQKIAIAGGIPLPMLLPLLAGMAMLVIVALRKSPASAFILSLALFAAITDISANYIVAPLDHASVKPLAAMLEPRLKAGDMVVAYDSYFQDLPVYLHRNVTVAGYEGELQFGVEHYPQTRAWMISADQFWQRCAQEPQAHIYVFMKKTTLASLKIPAGCPLRVIGDYGKNVLMERPSQ